MLIQHLLTERLMRNLFQNPEFTQRNVIAAQVENVIDALASGSFSTAGVPAEARPVLQGHRTGRRQPQPLHREAGFPELGLRAVLPAVLARRSPTPTASCTRRARSWTTCASRVEEALKEEFGYDAGVARSGDPRPVHRHRQFHREPDRPDAGKGAGGSLPATGCSPTK